MNNLLYLDGDTVCVGELSNLLNPKNAISAVKDSCLKERIKKYSMLVSIPRIITPVITRLVLNTCDPYIIKYPSPFFDTRSSPMITPIIVIVREIMF